MTYVASPSHAVGNPGRLQDLKQCLEIALKHLNETSKASDAEKQAELVASAVEAGWGDDEVRSIVASVTDPRTQDAVFPAPTFGVLPSSSM